MRVNCFTGNCIDYEVASLLIEKIHNIIEEKGRVVLALSGGSSPAKLYQLIGASVDKRFVDIILVDERVVPCLDERSNVSFLRKNLGALADSVIEYVTTGDRFIEESEELIAKFPNIDLALLGMGDDGHTASLFTDRDLLKKGRLVNIKKAGEDISRISLSYSELLNVSEIFLFIKGKDKFQMRENVLEQDIAQRFPAGKVIWNHGNITVMCEEY